MATATAQPGPPPNSMNMPSIPAYSHASNGLPSLDSESHDDVHLHIAKSNIPRGPVTATMNFYKPPEDGAKPYNYVEPQPEGTPQRNFTAFDHEISIRDLRGSESKYDLDVHAFAALQSYPEHPEVNWDDDASIKENYYPEVEKILLDRIPGSPYKIILFDHTVRRANPNAARAPVTRCHIDQTPKSAEMRVELHLSEAEAAQVLKDGTRYRIINVWRPINGAVESFPLGFANSATVPDSDMVSVEHRYPERTGETAAVKYNPDHEWYYWSGIDDTERMLLQCFDSANPGNRVPHSAFVDPRSGEQSKPRESIEVRALILG